MKLAYHKLATGLHSNFSANTQQEGTCPLINTKCSKFDNKCVKQKWPSSRKMISKICFTVPSSKTWQQNWRNCDDSANELHACLIVLKNSLWVQIQEWYLKVYHMKWLPLSTWSAVLQTKAMWPAAKTQHVLSTALSHTFYVCVVLGGNFRIMAE